MTPFGPFEDDTLRLVQAASLNQQRLRKNRFYLRRLHRGAAIVNGLRESPLHKRDKVPEIGQQRLEIALPESVRLSFDAGPH